MQKAEASETLSKLRGIRGNVHIKSMRYTDTRLRGEVDKSMDSTRLSLDRLNDKVRSPRLHQVIDDSTARI